MKILTILCFLFITLQLTFAANKKNSGNGWVSSGGDHLPSSHAWFSGTKRISYCIIKNPNFSKSLSELKEYIFRASHIWKNYFDQKALKRFQNKDFIPQFEFEFEECQNSTEIRFYFDMNDSDVNQAIKKFNDPMAFSVLKEYDFKTTRGKGFIWFSDIFKADDSLNQESLNSIILHELGHVYGIGHVKDTIMDENIASVITASGAKAGYPTNFPYMNNLLLSIDQKRPLYFRYHENFNYVGHVPFDLKNIETVYRVQADIINNIFGRMTNGPINAKFTNSGNWVNYQLALQDYNGSTIVNIKLDSESTIHKGAELFKVVGLDKDEHEITQSLQTEYYELFGSLTTSTGKIISLIITLNMGEYYPVKIRAIVDGKTYLLFAEGAPGTYYSR